MNIEHEKITEKIHLLTFETQLDITSTFLRFQEHYESPRFRGEIFTLDEFKKWYTDNSPNGVLTGEFTYYSDWHGFNIPSYVLRPFYEGKFSPISEKEEGLLNLFKDEKEIFYIIGVHKETKSINQVLDHEIAHGLFYTNDGYRTEIMQVLSQFDINPIKEELRSKAGYHEEVLIDEAHAYIIDLAKSLKTEIPEKLSEKLREIYNSYRA